VLSGGDFRFSGKMCPTGSNTITQCGISNYVLLGSRCCGVTVGCRTVRARRQGVWRRGGGKALVRTL
jgi:hypothetical protein